MKKLTQPSFKWGKFLVFSFCIWINSFSSLQLHDLLIGNYWVCYPKVMLVQSASLISDRGFALVPFIFCAKYFIISCIAICFDRLFILAEQAISLPISIIYFSTFEYKKRSLVYLLRKKFCNYVGKNVFMTNQYDSQVQMCLDMCFAPSSKWSNLLFVPF